MFRFKRESKVARPRKFARKNSAVSPALMEQIAPDKQRSDAHSKIDLEIRILEERIAPALTFNRCETMEGENEWLGSNSSAHK